ncbi:MAG: hypothetical protein ABSH47_25410, partial [Bryobacteraceae bacterium]
RCEAERQRARRQSEYERLSKKAENLCRKQGEVVAFIWPFARDVAVLSDRLPPEWDFYRSALKGLRVDSRGAWADPPTSPDLDTLELRLGQMLNLAAKSPPVAPKEPAIGTGAAESMVPQPKQPAAAVKGGTETVVKQNGSEVPADMGTRTAESTPRTKEAQGRTRKGDTTLLKRADGNFYESVNFPTAQSYADIGARRRQQLMKNGLFEVLGKGTNRRITVKSLIAYCPPAEDAK